MLATEFGQADPLAHGEAARLLALDFGDLSK
jgi:hypothetical protein